MKLVFGSLLGLLAFGLSSANAQFAPLYGSPFTNPLQAPFANPYNPYSFFTNPYTYLGNPALRGYGNLAGNQGGMSNAGFTGTSVPIVQNLGDPSMTGHPTLFNAYSQYFFNQGGMSTGGTGGSTSGTAAPQTTAAGVFGSPPPRPRTNPRP